MDPNQLAVLRWLLSEQRVLSLALVADNEPIIGLLPYAVTGDWRALVVHASRLARHTKGLVEGAAFDALIHEAESEAADPMQVKRVTLRGVVRVLAREEEGHAEARGAYLDRFPQAEPITALGDFAFYRLEITGGRLVTGFASAVNVTSDALVALAAEA